MNELAVETIKTFVATLPSFVSNLETAIQFKDSKALELAAHTIKGSVSNFFADEAIRLAGLIESQSQIEDIKNVEKTWALLKSELYFLSSELKKMVHELQK